MIDKITIRRGRAHNVQLDICY